MKVIFGSIITDGSGSIGDHTVTRNHYGRYMRHKSTVIPARSPYWTPIWTQRTAIQTAWKTLDAAQFKAWDSAARLHARSDEWGRQFFLPAYNYFTSVNMNRYFCGEAITNDPPIFVAPSYFANSTLEFNDVTNTFTLVYSPALPADVKFKVWTSAPLSSGRHFAGNAYRLLGTYLPDFGNTLDFSSDYFARFAVWPVNPQNVFCKINQVHKFSGQESLSIQAQASYI